MPFSIDFNTGIVSLGSCFSDEIGLRLQEGGFLIEQNPFGTLYNPASIASALHRIIDDREIGEKDLVEHEGVWHSWRHHGSFSRPTKEECMEACNSRLHQAHQALKDASLLMVTFGSAWVYELSSPLVEGGGWGAAVVANCHKLPPQNFVRRCLSIDEIVTLWQSLLQELSTFNSQLSTIFTVSPIRHMADGAHGNQLSKSTLLLAIDELVHFHINTLEHSHIYYFPAYEIVLDELRDYRFYGPDMVHPSSLAVDVVWDRFQSASMTPSVREQAHCNRKQMKRQQHIPLYKV